MKLPILQHIEFLHWCIDARPPKLFQIQHLLNIVFFSHSIVFWTWHHFLSICPHLQFCIGIVASLFRNTKPLRGLERETLVQSGAFPILQEYFLEYFQKNIFKNGFKEYSENISKNISTNMPKNIFRNMSKKISKNVC